MNEMDASGMTPSDDATRIHLAESESQIRACFPVFSELRPHLSEEVFVEQVRRQRQDHGYRIAFVLADERVVAGAGYRVSESLSWGRFLYLDDLVTASAARRRGHGARLLDWLLVEGRRLGCRQFHLDSGPQRHDAHRLYMGRNLMIGGYHFWKPLD